MTPFKCPACDGFGKRARKEGGKKKCCRACNGECIVWQPAHFGQPYFAHGWWNGPGWYGGLYYTSSLSVGTTTIDASTVSTSIADMAGTTYTSDMIGGWTDIKAS